MAKKDKVMCKPHGCRGFLSVILIVGILYLLKDLAVVDWTLGIQWFTALFVLIGVHSLFCKCQK